MATFLSPDHMTLSEALELQVSKDDAAFIREVEKKSALTQIVPWYPTSNGDVHKGVKATALPAGKFGAINAAVPTGTAATKAYEEGVKVFELKSDVDTRITQSRSKEQAARIRSGRDRLYGMGFMQSFADNVVNNAGTDPDSVMGILARRSVIDGKYVINAGGTTTNKVGSILLMRPGEDGFNFRYPDTYPSFEKQDLGIVQAMAKDSSGNITGTFPAWETLWRLYYCMDCPDDEALIRIVNVPSTTAMTTATRDVLIDTINSLKNQGQGYVAFGPKQIVGSFWKYIADKSNIAFSQREVEHMGRPSFIFNVPFFAEEYFSGTEALITAAA